MVNNYYYKKVKKDRIWLYLPIEIKIREFYGKILLACFASINDFSVVIGPRRSIYPMLSFSPKGIIFGFGLCKNFLKSYLNYKKKGFKIVTWDEEGLVTLKDELYVRYRISKKALKIVEKFFCWGEKHTFLTRSLVNEARYKIHTTGNPRFDLLRPEFRGFFTKDAERIKKKYGKIILINTNFGHANHFLGTDYTLESLKSKGWMNSKEDSEYFMRRVEWQEKMFSHFKKTIPLLSEKFKEYTIIVRPHPSENRKVWEKIVNKYPNVLAVHSGNVIPWIIAAEIVIHNNCTTAIESYLLDKNVISFRPIIEEEYESDLPNALSIQARSQEELINTLNKILKENYFRKDPFKNEKLNFYLSGLNKETASELIIKELKNITKEDSPKKVNNVYLFVYNLKCLLIKIAKKILGSNFGENIGDRYIVHKMPDLTEQEIREVIERFSKLDKKFSKVKVKTLGPECFHIYTNE